MCAFRKLILSISLLFIGQLIVVSVCVCMCMYVYFMYVYIIEGVLIYEFCCCFSDAIINAFMAFIHSTN